jgi:signal transduction histidine kinase/streptogramin lyase
MRFTGKVKAFKDVCWRSAFTCAFVGWGLCVPLFGLNPASQLSQYAHTAWRIQDGLFDGAPFSVVQTADGYLWIGTNSGLLRFDGVQFVPWVPPAGQQLPSKLIVILVAGKDGGLWIGTANGLAYWDNKNLTRSVKGYEFVQSIFEDSDGSVWFTHSGSPTGVKEPLCHLTGATVKCYGELDGIPSGDVNAAVRMAVGAQHEFWLGTGRSILKGKPGSFGRFAPLGLANGDPQGPMAIVPMTDGSAWVGMGDAGPGLGLQALNEGHWKATIIAGFDSSKLVVRRLLLDRDGCLWIGTANEGLYRLHNGGVDHFAVEDGLSGNDVMSLYEDHEGSIWVATTNGLDRFHDLPVVTFSSREGLDADSVEGVMAFRDGTVRVGKKGSLIALRQGRVSSPEIIKGLPGDQVTCMLEDHAGRLWVGIDRELFTYQKGKFTRVAWPDGSSFGRVFGIAEDDQNDIWVEHRGSPSGIIRIRDGMVAETLSPPGVPDAREVATDPKGGIWLGPGSGGLAHYQNGKLESYPVHTGPDAYGARQVIVAPEGFVFGALGVGLMVVRDGRAQVLTVGNGLPCDNINGVVLDGTGYVWLYSECGLTSIAMSDLEKWWGHPGLVISAKTLDALDGVHPGRAPFQISARSTDGKLWFVNGLVLQMMDPTRKVANSVPPPVHIEVVKADRNTYSALQNLRLPALTRDLEFDYTALSLVMPQRVRFRYRLEGYDADWVDAGIRRSAFYTNLGPRKYIFRVIACNNDGVWNEKGAALTFDLQPAFFQTVWFRLLCAIVVAGILWLFYLFRLKQATEQIQERLGARLEERERIARELHDTLLQGFQGLILRLQGAMKTLPAEAPASRMIEKILDRADEVLLEGRQSVRDLREEGARGDEFSEVLTTYGSELAEGSSVAFSLNVMGSPQALSAIVFSEARRIAREALLNAFQHSQASKIEAELTYDNVGVCLRIRDNGVGVLEQILGSGKPGHWGLSGMRERADKIGAKLNIWSRPGAGTEIELTIPAKVAYPQEQKKSLSRLIERMRFPRFEKRN